MTFKVLKDFKVDFERDTRCVHLNNHKIKFIAVGTMSKLIKLVRCVRDGSLQTAISAIGL